MYNTIRLLSGCAQLTQKEYAAFSKGDTIFGIDSDTKELRRWSAEQKEAAREKLKKYRCEYIKTGETISITEYALEYFDVDENGEFISGSDFDLAKEK